MNFKCTVFRISNIINCALLGIKHGHVVKLKMHLEIKIFLKI